MLDVVCPSEGHFLQPKRLLIGSPGFQTLEPTRFVFSFAWFAFGSRNLLLYLKQSPSFDLGSAKMVRGFCFSVGMGKNELLGRAVSRQARSGDGAEMHF